MLSRDRGALALFRELQKRHGRARRSVRLKDGTDFLNPLLWSCKDGDVAFYLEFTPAFATPNRAVLECAKQDGIDIGFMEHWEWDKKGWADATPEEAEKLLGIIGKFFLNHTKAELLKLATEKRFQLGPCNNAADVLQYPQLLARDFWKEVEHPELGTTIKYPGGAVVTTQGYCGVRHRAPLIGEHNDDVYRKGLGISARELNALKKQRVI